MLSAREGRRRRRTHCGPTSGPPPRMRRGCTQQCCSCMWALSSPPAFPHPDAMSFARVCRFAHCTEQAASEPASERPRANACADAWHKRFRKKECPSAPSVLQVQSQYILHRTPEVRSCRARVLSRPLLARSSRPTDPLLVPVVASPNLSSRENYRARGIAPQSTSGNVPSTTSLQTLTTMAPAPLATLHTLSVSAPLPSCRLCSRSCTLAEYRAW